METLIHNSGSTFLLIVSTCHSHLGLQSQSEREIQIKTATGSLRFLTSLFKWNLANGIHDTNIFLCEVVEL